MEVQNQKHPYPPNKYNQIEMGQFLEKGVTERVEYDEESENGLLLCDRYIPSELLTELLCYVDYKSLLNCQLVCKRWHALIHDYVWWKKAELTVGHPLLPDKNMSWHAYYLMCKKKPFGRNLVKNHSGELGLKYWDVINEDGDRWIVENPPIGVEPLPKEPVLEGKHHCFVTSYYECSKRQIIDLQEAGFIPYVLDVLQPPIVVSEWYSCRFDCPAIYKSAIQLLAEDGSLLDSIEFGKAIEGDDQNKWHYVSHEFRNYGAGLRKISFYHAGKDLSFWSGHYGSKMAGACVYVKIPEVEQPYSDESDTSDES